jgi:ribosomal protein S12 methylthiotransferase
VYLSDLIYALDETLPDSVKWLRIHYAHPAHLSQRIIECMAASEKVCHYLDMPIQHASDSILKSMRRGLGKEGIRNRIKKLRDTIPDIRLRTTLIVGYPGETEFEFQELYDFVKEIRFDRLGVFTYSEEEGTIAADLKDNVLAEVKNERKARIMDLQAGISAEKNMAMGYQSLYLNTEGDGNIGIGTTSPVEKLHIVGNTYTSGFLSAASRQHIRPLAVGKVMEEAHPFLFVVLPQLQAAAAGAIGF